MSLSDKQLLHQKDSFVKVIYWLQFVRAKFCDGIGSSIFAHMDKPIRVEGIDVDIQIVFRSHHMELVLPHYNKVGLSPQVLDEMIDGYIASGELVTYERWILEYGQRVINPMMNKKLGRAMDHPTFNNLLRFALKEVIENDPTLKLFKKL